MTTIDRTKPGEARETRVRPMDPAIASALRRICTMLRFHRGCPFKVCRRANACATRNVVCYRSMEEEIKPIVRSIIARRWRARVEAGGNPDVAPARRDGWIRLLAWEEAEIPRLLAGEYGGNDAPTPYQRWLRNWVGQEERVATRMALPLTGGEPHDPDARVTPWIPPRIAKTGDAPPPLPVTDTPRRD